MLLEHPYGGGYFGNWVDNVHNAIDINTGLSDVNTERRGICAECVNSVADWRRGRDWRGRSGEQERWVAFQVAEQAEQACEAYKGYTKSVDMLNHRLAIALEGCPNQSLKSISAAG